MCWWKNSFASYSAARFVDGGARLLDVILFHSGPYKELARCLLTLDRGYWRKCLQAKAHFVIGHPVSIGPKISMLYAWFLGLAFKYHCGNVEYFDSGRCAILWTITLYFCESNTKQIFLSTFFTSHISKSRTWEHFLYILHIQNSLAALSEVQINPSWGRGIYFANISIKWSVKVRLGGRQGWEVRELPGCGQRALAITFTLSAFPLGQKQGEFWGGVTKWSLYRSESIKESFWRFN